MLAETMVASLEFCWVDDWVGDLAGGKVSWLAGR